MSRACQRFLNKINTLMELNNHSKEDGNEDYYLEDVIIRFGIDRSRSILCDSVCDLLEEGYEFQNPTIRENNKIDMSTYKKKNTKKKKKRKKDRSKEEL